MEDIDSNLMSLIEDCKSLLRTTRAAIERLDDEIYQLKNRNATKEPYVNYYSEELKDKKRIKKEYIRIHCAIIVKLVEFTIRNNMSTTEANTNLVSDAVPLEIIDIPDDPHIYGIKLKMV